MQLMMLQKQVDDLSAELYRQSLAMEKLLKRIDELEKADDEGDFA